MVQGRGARGEGLEEKGAGERRGGRSGKAEVKGLGGEGVGGEQEQEAVRRTIAR